MYNDPFHSNTSNHNNTQKMYNLADIPDPGQDASWDAPHNPQSSWDAPHNPQSSFHTPQEQHPFSQIDEYQYFKKLSSLPLPSYMKWVNQTPPTLRIRKLDQFTFTFGLLWTVFTVFFDVLAFIGGMTDVPFFVYLILIIFPFVGIGMLAAGLSPYIKPIFLAFYPSDNQLVAYRGNTMVPIKTFNLDAVYVQTASTGGRDNGEPVYNIVLTGYDDLPLVKGIKSRHVGDHIGPIQRLINTAKP